MLRKASVILLFIIIILSISTITLATKYTPSKFGDAISSSDVDTTEIKDLGGQIVGIIQIVGTAVSVGTMTVLGIKYVMGSAEEKAAYKKTLLPYLVGAVLLFGATNLTQIIYTWTNSLDTREPVKVVNAIKGEYNETDDIYTYTPDLNEVKPGENYIVVIPAEG